MSRPWKIALILAVILLLAFSISLAWGAPQSSNEAKLPTFSAKDRQLIETYYSHVIGTLAPGSIERSPFGLGVETALAPGSHVPMQLEKDLQPLPSKLDLELSQITGEYARYTLGRHVVLVRKADLAIGDIIKNIAVALNK
jgi:hypothetical protein